MEEMTPDELEKFLKGVSITDTLTIPEGVLRTDTYSDIVAHPTYSEHLRVDTIADDTIHIDYDFYKDENSKSRDILYNAYIDALERVLRCGAETTITIVFRQLGTERFTSKEYTFDGREDFFSFLRTLRGIRDTEHTRGNIIMLPISSMYGGRLTIDMKFTSDREFINGLVPNAEIDTILELIS